MKNSAGQNRLGASKSSRKFKKDSKPGFTPPAGLGGRPTWVIPKKKPKPEKKM